MDQISSQYQVRRTILNALFDRAESLRLYLLARLPREIADQLVDAVDATLDREGAAYADFLDDTRVAWSTSDRSPDALPYEVPEDDGLGSIVRSLQADLLHSDRQATNIICLGYKLVCSRNIMRRSYLCPPLQIN